MATATETLPKKRRREETRQRLMEAALNVFAQRGYERATVDEVVKEAGFSKGAFYVHFESKEDLFWAMLDERIAAMQEAFRRALDVEAPVVENERRLLTTIFDFEKQQRSWPALFMEFVAHAGRNDKVREQLSALYQRWHSFAVEILTQGQEAGRVRKDLDVAFMASVIIALIEGSIMQSRLAPDSARLDNMVEPLSKLLAEWLER